MSDRKVTVGDMEYEPNQTKVASFGNCLVLVAGDLAIHSQAIQDTDKELKSRHLPSRDIAIIYGRAIQAVNARHAESEILAPLGLNTDAFQAKQKDFSQGFVIRLPHSYKIDSLPMLRHWSSVRMASVLRSFW